MLTLRPTPAQKRRDKEHDSRAELWWLDNQCPDCGGNVESRRDNLTGHVYGATCRKCGLGFRPTFNEEAPWKAIDRPTVERRYAIRAIESARRMDEIRHKLRPATSGDWRAYLRARTQPPTHNYDYGFQPDDFFVALDDVVVPSACGSAAINVIAPKGIKATHEGGLTHCQIFRMDDPDSAGGWVPTYSDTRLSQG